MLVRKKKSREFFRWLMIKPARMIMSSFLLIGIIGFTLLMLPMSTQSGFSIGPVNALFTTVSAMCVTGLVVFDTASTFSTFGRGVILGLIQIGGLGLVTITTFFLTMMRRKVGLKTRLLAQESSGSFSFIELPSLLRSIILMTLSFQLFGFLLYSTQFVPLFGWRKGITLSAFQSVSAFCNAGFDLMGDTQFGPYSSLTAFSGNSVVLMTTIFLVVSGGLGFIVWRDLFEAIKTRKLRLHTRMTLFVTGFLIVFGFLFILGVEWTNTGENAMGTLPVWQRPIAALFQSVTLRTAGFNTLEMSSLLDATKVLCVVFMFIGAGSGSTGGGVKVSTFLLLVYAVTSEIRGRNSIIIRKYQVPRVAVQRAIAIFIMGMALVLILSILLCFSEAEALASGRLSYIDLLFESVSAFGTVGLSAANTSDLSSLSHAIMIPVMFMGRVGPITVAVSLALREPKEYSSVYPEGKIHIG